MITDNQISFARRTLETVRNENWTKSAPLGIVVEVEVVVVGIVVDGCFVG